MDDIPKKKICLEDCINDEVHQSDSLDDICLSENNAKESKNESDNLNEEAKEYDKNDGDNNANLCNDNNSNTHIVAAHYNELKSIGREERKESCIFYMRNFNNWIKSCLILEYMTRIKNEQRKSDGIRVLDMCCGKGGDLLKWEKMQVSHLICTDIAEISVQQCKSRFEDLIQRAEQSKFAHKFTAEFFTCDCTLVRIRQKFKDPSMKLNLVSCQFALHYSFESLTQANCMVRNAAECLQPGGYFIVTIPDAYEIMKRLRASDKERSIGNDIYKIDFVSDTNPPPLFGAKYEFLLDGAVNCPEFLVHMPTFVKLCRKHGLQLQRKTPFADYYAENKENGHKLLMRMKGLEAVYSDSVHKDSKFEHLKHMTNGGSHNPIYTLSKSEWEVVTLYMVCAFRKCKNTWDAEGKPVYEFDDTDKV